jgi:protein N-terminal methyltransferase
LLKTSTLYNRTYQVGLQDFEYERTDYDCIWLQWVLCYLTDQDLIKFFKKSKDHLSPTGMIFIKENVANDMLPVFDETDSSMVRSREHFEELIKESGLQIVSQEYQEGFPEELFKVSIWAVKKAKESL